MLKLTYLKHVVETKGLIHSGERVAQVVSRFSQGRKRFNRMISCLEKEFSNKNIRITFCVSANLLERHFDLIEKLRALGHPIAAHGYHHTKMTNYSKDQQLEILKRAHRVFSDLGVSVSGFRCPYLNFNQDTIEAFQSSAYLWTSQKFIFWKNGLDGNVSRLFSLYSTTSATETLSLPQYRGKILEIPITAPDDEMLYERYRVRDVYRISKTWCDLFDQTYQHGELFHLLFHPERFGYIKDAILNLLKQVNTVQPAVWTPSLDELTKWWRQRMQIEYRLQPSASGGWDVWIKSPRESTILRKCPVRQQRFATESDSTETNIPIYKDYTALRRIERGTSGNRYPAGDQKKHVIGIAWSCPDNLVQFLREEGFLVERSANPQEYSLFMTGRDELTETGKRALLEEIDACQQPLLRIWRWPHGARSALVISADVDAIDLRDFVHRTARF